jgi:hypothetical protein
VNFLDPLSKHQNKSPHVLPNQQLEFISYKLETKSPTIVGYYVPNPGENKVVMFTKSAWNVSTATEKLGFAKYGAKNWTTMPTTASSSSFFKTSTALPKGSWLGGGGFLARQCGCEKVFYLLLCFI